MARRTGTRTCGGGGAMLQYVFLLCYYYCANVQVGSPATRPRAPTWIVLFYLWLWLMNRSPEEEAWALSPISNNIRPVPVARPAAAGKCNTRYVLVGDSEDLKAPVVQYQADNQWWTKLVLLILIVATSQAPPRASAWVGCAARA